MLRQQLEEASVEKEKRTSKKLFEKEQQLADEEGGGDAADENAKFRDGCSKNEETIFLQQIPMEGLLLLQAKQRSAPAKKHGMRSHSPRKRERPRASSCLATVVVVVAPVAATRAGPA
jgi:hypothetical protein